MVTLVEGPEPHTLQLRSSHLLIKSHTNTDYICTSFSPRMFLHRIHTKFNSRSLEGEKVTKFGATHKLTSSAQSARSARSAQFNVFLFHASAEIYGPSSLWYTSCIGMAYPLASLGCVHIWAHDPVCPFYM